MSLLFRYNRPTLFNDSWDDSFNNLIRWGSTLKNNTDTNTPSANVRETDSTFLIDVAAPGLKKSDFNVTLEGTTLSLSYETKEETTGNLTRREFSYGSFKRSWAVPKGTTPSDVNASYDAGILTLSVKKPVVEQPTAQQIEVQ